MTYKFLLKIIATFSFFTFAPIAIAQERPECYIIEESGQLTDLTDICNVSRQRSSQVAPANNPNTANDNTNVVNFNPVDIERTLGNDYLLGGRSFLNRSATFNRSIGFNNTPYTGSYIDSTPVVTRAVTRRTFRFYQYPTRPSSTITPRVFPFIYPY